MRTDSCGTLPDTPRYTLPRAGFLLIDALAALGVLSAGLLPVAGFAPAALRWWQQQAQLSHALRVAIEAAEMSGPQGQLTGSASLASPAGRAGVPAPRWCRQWVAAATPCPPGSRIVLVAPLPDYGSLLARGATGLRGIALWVSP